MTDQAKLLEKLETQSPIFEETDPGFLDVSHVIDIHRLPEDLRKLAVFLMLAVCRT